MTVCIAALCENASKVVIASDRMLTGGDVEFEQDIRKFEKITDGCIALTAGSALEQVNLIRRCKSEIGQSESTNVDDIVSAMKVCYVALRLQKAEELHLKPLGLTLSKFLGSQSSLDSDLVLRLTHNIENEDLGVGLLIAGVDSSGGHVYLVSDPGSSSCYDAVGFCAIGSGERHAELTFIRSNFSESFSLRRALFLSYRAKRDAETAPGVGGNFTDLAYVDEHGLHIVSDSDLRLLDKAYDTLQERRNSVDSEIGRLVESLTLDEQGG